MKNLISVTAGFCLLLITSVVSAQSPGLIVRPAGGNGITTLNPNGNAYSSATTAGFLLNDILESKIPFKVVPPAINEPTGDLATGPSGGFTDIVQYVDGSGFYLYKDATNVFFRLRIGNIVNGSKGYSVLIDTDAKMGTSDPNYVAPSGNGPGNPGFEYEVVLQTNFQVAVYNIDGTTTPGLPVATFPLLTHSQISVALSTDGNNPDYFYDWYVPMTAIGSPASVRLAVTTVTSPNSALQGSRSDIYGVNDALYASAAAAWAMVAQAQPEINLSTFTGVNATCTSAPTLAGSISTGAAVTVSGSWTRLESTKPSTATITLYKNGSPSGTTVVTSGNTWSIIVPTVANGDVFYAKAQATGESQCLQSNQLTASSCLTLPATPVLSCASLKGISGSMPSGATVSVYAVPTTTASPFSNQLSNISNLTYPGGAFAFFTNGCSGGTNNVAAGSYMLVSQNGSCTSAPVFVCINSGSSGVPPAIATNSLAVSSALIPSSTIVSGTGATAGDILRLFINGTYHSSIAATGSAFNFTGVSFKTGDQVKIYSQTGSGCITQSNAFGVSCYVDPPAIKLNSSGNLLTGQTTISGIASPGASVQLYKGTFPSGATVGSLVTASSSGSWSATIPALASAETYYAIQTSAGCTSSASSLASVLAPSVCPLISGTYSDVSSSVSGTMPSSFTGTIRLYLDDALIGSQSITGATSWSIAVPANNLYYNGVLKATAQAAGATESNGCGTSTVSCTSPAIPTVTPVLSSIAPGGSITYSISNVTAGAWYSISDNSGISYALSLLNTGSSSFNLTTKNFASTGIYNLKISADGLTGCPLSSRSVSVNVNLILPLTLLDFSGRYQNKSSYFSWITTSEENTSHFELERKDNNTNEYIKAAAIPFTDNNSGRNTFSYALQGELTAATNFRLKIIDKNGASQYSKSVQLEPEKQEQGVSSISPNPFSDQLIIAYTARTSGAVNCTLTNASGSMINSSRHETAKGSNMIRLQQLSQLPAGTYFLTVQDVQTSVKKVHRVQKVR
ncbi:MAG: T9SS type A sorting domain-containing protein [Chitinophagaceae bacterium]|nr:T9SS type A sorting domain-containing protein [Chitinophagaceae bacterium]